MTDLLTTEALILGGALLAAATGGSIGAVRWLKRRRAERDAQRR